MAFFSRATRAAAGCQLPSATKRVPHRIHVFVGDGPDQHKLKRDGMIVFGAAVGSDDFVVAG